MARRLKKTTEEFVSELKTVNPSIKVIGQYEGCKTKIKVCCLKCNHVWSAQPSNLLQGVGCPECARIHAGDYHKRNQESFIADLEQRNPNIKVIGQYINARTPIRVKCLKCGYEWNANPDVLMNRTPTCVNCKKSGTSQVEQFLLESLKHTLGADKVKSRTKTPIGMELDIYLPENKVAIEYGSWYWHKRQLKRDIEKRERCRKKNIRLITVYDAIESDKPFEEDCITFEKPLSLSKLDELVSLVKIILSDIGYISDIDIDWKQIREIAIHNVDVDKDKRFKEKLRKTNPSIVVLDSYAGYFTNLKCKCKVCGHEWETSPSNLLGNGGKEPTGCPNCAKRDLIERLTKPHEAFVEELKEKNPTIIPLGTYSGANKKILVRCSVCDFEWDAPSGHLLQGRGCPKCSKVYRRTEADFIEELSTISPTIKAISAYVNTETKISVKCLVCGYEWETTPASLLGCKGKKPSVCPSCRRKKLSDSFRKTNEQFIKELQDKNPTIIPLTEYEKTHTKIKARCSVCGHEWWVTPAHLLSGQGCPMKRKH